MMTHSSMAVYSPVHESGEDDEALYDVVYATNSTSSVCLIRNVDYGAAWQVIRSHAARHHPDAYRVDQCPRSHCWRFDKERQLHVRID